MFIAKVPDLFLHQLNAHRQERNACKKYTKVHLHGRFHSAFLHCVFAIDKLALTSEKPPKAIFLALCNPSMNEL
jgi:hypothetical protein